MSSRRSALDHPRAARGLIECWEALQGRRRTNRSRQSSAASIARPPRSRGLRHQPPLAVAGLPRSPERRLSSKLKSLSRVGTQALRLRSASILASPNLVVGARDRSVQTESRRVAIESAVSRDSCTRPASRDPRVTSSTRSHRSSPSRTSPNEGEYFAESRALSRGSLDLPVVHADPHRFDHRRQETVRPWADNPVACLVPA